MAAPPRDLAAKTRRGRAAAAAAAPRSERGGRLPRLAASPPPSPFPSPPARAWRVRHLCGGARCIRLEIDRLPLSRRRQYPACLPACARSPRRRRLLARTLRPPPHTLSSGCAAVLLVSAWSPPWLPLPPPPSLRRRPGEVVCVGLPLRLIEGAYLRPLAPLTPSVASPLFRSPLLAHGPARRTPPALPLSLSLPLSHTLYLSSSSLSICPVAAPSVRSLPQPAAASRVLCVPHSPSSESRADSRRRHHPTALPLLPPPNVADCLCVASAPRPRVREYRDRRSPAAPTATQPRHLLPPPRPCVRLEESFKKLGSCALLWRPRSLSLLQEGAPPARRARRPPSGGARLRALRGCG